jgi:hypothetical protein
MRDPMTIPMIAGHLARLGQYVHFEREGVERTCNILCSCKNPRS